MKSRGVVQDQHAVQDALDLATLPPGMIVEARTQNSTYQIRAAAGGNFEIRRKSEEFPEFARIDRIGALLTTGEVYDHWVVRGLKLEIWAGTKRVYTSRVDVLRIGEA